MTEDSPSTSLVQTPVCHCFWECRLSPLIVWHDHIVRFSCNYRCCPASDFARFAALPFSRCFRLTSHWYKTSGNPKTMLRQALEALSDIFPDSQFASSRRRPPLAGSALQESSSSSVG